MHEYPGYKGVNIQCKDIYEYPGYKDIYEYPGYKG